MNKHQLKFYPVENGDMSLITLSDKTTILIDCNIRQSSIGSTDPAVYDVKSDLLKSISKRNNNPFVDVFVLTHGDNDHCRGFITNFYQGDPKKYSQKNRDAEEVIIDEMWFSPMIAEENSNNDEDVHQQEAERRLDLHRKNDTDKDLPGNRIKIVGYDGNKDYSDLNHLRAVPGTVVKEFNNSIKSTFSVFIHAPFKEHLTSTEIDKNSASIVFQARFKEFSFNSNYACLAMFGGDSDHHSWKIILEKTKKYRNDINEQALKWDLFLAPHHCSWSFFNERPQKENPEPKTTSLEILGNKRLGAKVIASSKKIEDNDDNPPHYQAKQEYIKNVKEANFLNTAIEPEEKHPEPIEFEIGGEIIRTGKGAKAEALRQVANKISIGSLGTTATGKLSEITENVVRHQPHRFYGNV